jgi:hypothetical protein
MGGLIAMTRSVQFVRLLAAVTISLATCRFVALYDQWSYLRFQYDHPGEKLNKSDAGYFVADYSKYAYVVPLAGLAAGILTIWRRPNSPVLVEVIVSVLWVLAFTWVGLVLILWQVFNVPTISSMRLHY